MKTKIIDGKKIALNVKNEIIQSLSAKKWNRQPKLLIFYIGYNKASELYIKYKAKFAKECGVDVEILKYDNDTSENIIIDSILKANNDNGVDGIMIQLPISSNKNINTNKLLECIAPNKDVDGLTSYTLGKTWFNEKTNVNSSTALAVMRILEEEKINLDGKNVVIIGSTIVLGKPLAGMINNKHATISILNSSTKNISYYTKNADIIVSATGIKRLLKKEMVSNGVILIDVGTNKDENNKTHGDFEIEEMNGIASIISPSPGGVGPITISMLVLNTLKSFLLNINGDENEKIIS